MKTILFVGDTVLVQSDNNWNNYKSRLPMKWQK